MNQIVLAIAAILALLAAGGAGGTAKSHASVRPAHAGSSLGLRPLDSFPPTGL